VRTVLALILAAVTALSIALWLRALQLRAGAVMLTALILLTLSSYAVLEGLFAEQLGLLVGFLLAASLAALVRERLFLSGSLLALALIKPQMILLVVIYLLLWTCVRWRIRWPFVAGFFSVSALLLRLFPAGVAALDSRMAAGTVRLPAILHAAARESFGSAIRSVRASVQF